MKKIAIINGPNLNILGKRNTAIYGDIKLEAIIDECSSIANKKGFEIVSFQSNSEGSLIDYIQQIADKVDGIIINAGAYSHTSIAIADAIADAGLPTIEVHLSNIFGREDFRSFSLLSPLAYGVISGFREQSYYLALEAMIQLLKEE